MRTLSRPMFKMGGPIKEGVMHGIREPYRSGQLVQPGPGRPGYKGFSGVTGGYDTAYNLGNTANKANTASKAANLLNKAKAWKIPTDAQALRGIWGGLKKFYRLAPKQGFLARNPASLLALGAYFGGTPTPIDKKYGTTSRWENIFPMFGDTQKIRERKLTRHLEQQSNPNNWWRYNPGKYGPRKDHPDYDPAKLSINPWNDRGAVDTPIRYDKDGNIIRFNDAVSHFGTKVLPATGSVDDIIQKNITIKDDKSSDLPSVEKVLTDAEKKLIEEANLKKAKADKDKRVNELLEIMGYDKSKNDAVSKALIDASQIIGERGTLSKKNITRELINPIIAATGKRLEKPEQIREAVGLMMAKGEIEKDIFKSKRTASEQAIDALAAASGKSAKYIANAKLGIANSPAEAKAQLAKLKNTRITSDNLTAVIQQYADENNIPFKKQITTDQKNEVVGKGKKYASIVDMITDMKLDVDGADDGLYVVGTSIIEVTGGLPKLKG